MSTNASILAVFPGQGSQHVGMAREFYDNFAVAREAFEEASDAVRVDLKKLCFDGPESDLMLTENTQPCLLVASVASFRVAVTQHGFKPSCVAGHSLGEYSALVAAGALPLAKAAQWVKERGRSMQAAVPPGMGAMAAIMGVEDEKIEALCATATASAKTKRASGANTDYASVEAVVEPANFNSPGQIVIAGSKDAVDEALELLKNNPDYPGSRAVPLAVSAPFHCRLMRPARSRMAELFSQAERPAPLSYPYIPNRTARLTAESGVIFSLLTEQVDHPVLWKQTMQWALENGKTTIVECGPNKVLMGLAKRASQKLAVAVKLHSVSDLETLKKTESEGVFQ